jgi:hypothetical protein
VCVLSSCVVTLYGNTMHVGLLESVECGDECYTVERVHSLQCGAHKGLLCVADMMGCLPKA